MPSRSGGIVYDDKRTALTLGKLLKSGGAGSVFMLKERPLSVAKLYHAAKPGPAYQRKLTAMLALQPDLPVIPTAGIDQVQIAWPQSLLRDSRGRFIGFSMPVLDVSATTDLEHVLQERQAREEGLPTGLGAKMALAANLAVLLAALHRQRHYVVDLKPLNVRFYRHSLFIAMLDCDGFSIQGDGERFPAQQVTNDYLAPEFQKHGVTPGQEKAQDRFALAVIVFQLLNAGLHPYSGKPRGATLPSDLPGRIAANLYPYGMGKGNPWIEPAPVSGHATFPPALRDMFDQAFATSTPRRPSAKDWATLLLGYARRSEKQLLDCADDAGHQHFSGLPCAACARKALLAAHVRAAASPPRSGAGSTPMRGQSGGRRGAHTATPNVAATLAAQHAQNAANPVVAAGLFGRVLLAVAGPLVLGWGFSLGMPVYRAYVALSRPSWGDTFGMALLGGALLLAMALFVRVVPIAIMGKRP